MKSRRDRLFLVVFALFVASTVFYNVSLTFQAKGTNNALSWSNVLFLLLIVLTPIRLLTIRKFAVRLELVLSLGLLIVGLLSRLVAVDEALFNSIFSPVLRWVTIVWVAQLFVRNDRDIEYVLKVFVLASFIGVIATFIQEYYFVTESRFLFGLGTLDIGYSWFEWSDYRILRVTGFLTDPNYYALFPMSAFVILYTYLVYHPTGRTSSLRKKIGYVSIMLCFLAGVLLSFSRGAVLSIAVYLLYASITDRQMRRMQHAADVRSQGPLRRRHGRLSPLITISLVLIILTGLSYFVLSTRGAVDNSSITRLHLLEEGLKLMSTNPVGVGLGNIVAKSTIGMTSHNLFLEVGVSTGWIGLLLLLILVACGWVRTRSHLLLHSMYVVLVVSSVFLSSLIYPLFWIAIALSASRKYPLLQLKLRDSTARTPNEFLAT